jgi:hypothetical protein
MMTRPRPKLTEPLETITACFATFLLLTLTLGTVLTLVGSGSFEGFGRTPLCVTQPGAGYSGDWASHLGITHRQVRRSASTARSRSARRTPGSASGFCTP